MALRLYQLIEASGERVVAALDDALVGGALVALPEPRSAVRLAGATSVYELARAALAHGRSLRDEANARWSEIAVDLVQAEREDRLLPAIDHPDPAHLLLTGTGLTHLGSAEQRDRMHADAHGAAAGAGETDSMRMFRMGLAGGKPAPGAIGCQPEWFYKGDGGCVVGPGAPLVMPSFALDGGEEPEIAGIYVIDSRGAPRRLGFCLANEFSDHVTERQNYLWLAHSKLRPAALGAEILTGSLPQDIRGTSRIVRGRATIWERPFLTGEQHMSHTVSNLEQHHFKYASFRRPGDVHVHFFGTATLSFADGVSVRPQDAFEIAASAFRLPLRNRLEVAESPAPAVEAL